MGFLAAFLLPAAKLSLLLWTEFHRFFWLCWPQRSQSEQHSGSPFWGQKVKVTRHIKTLAAWVRTLLWALASNLRSVSQRCWGLRTSSKSTYLRVLDLKFTIRSSSEAWGCSSSSIEIPNTVLLQMRTSTNCQPFLALSAVVRIPLNPSSLTHSMDADVLCGWTLSICLGLVASGPSDEC